LNTRGLLLQLQGLVATDEGTRTASTFSGIGSAILAFANHLEFKPTTLAGVNLALLHFMTIRHVLNPPLSRILPMRLTYLIRYSRIVGKWNLLPHTFVVAIRGFE
jgi:hypothetical protein